MSLSPHGANASPQTAVRQNDDTDTDSDSGESDLHMNLFVIVSRICVSAHLIGEQEDLGLEEQGREDDYGEESGEDDETEVYDDIQVRIRGQTHTIIKGDDFLDLTSDCDPDTRQNLYDILKEYFDFLNTDQAFAQQQRDKIKGLSPTEKQELGVKVRDHIAEGRVIFCSFQPSDQDMARINSKVRESIGGNGTLVKISYATGPVDKRVSQLAKKCRLQRPEAVASYPGEKQDPIGFVHLLEMVIHELYATRRERMYCSKCDKTHEGIFEFEAVGKRKRVESTRLHVQSMAREILKWVDFLSELYPLHLSVADTQGKMLNLIKKKLSDTSTHALW
ncbi:hypothetical protein BGZ82_006423 [Podila clonocystis]|nr:hypothetical protein BGZ82_006423 [Podila clonocystis]